VSQHIPVIIGIGEIVDRPHDPAESLEPIALMAEALQRAAQDGSCRLQDLDSIDIVHQVSWRYQKTAQRLCDRLNIRPARAVYGITGGESPMRYLHEAALRIARGDSEFAAVVGGEAQYAVNKAKSLDLNLRWTPIASEVENPIAIEGRLHPLTIAHGAIRPIHIYPLYENASHVAWEQTPRIAQTESADLWSRFSSVATQNPYSWLTTRLSAEEIATPTEHNRMISYPYTKHMVANPAVNQGAAVILTSLACARAMNVDESRLIFIWGGASATEPRDYLARDQYTRSDAQEAVLKESCRLIEDNGNQLQALELYSCFPCVPKMTRRVLGLSSEITPTVTGGLSFFGAPLNNYMTHATCAMVRHLRDGKSGTGLLYGQGEFVTKHHALVVAKTPARRELSTDYDLQQLVDSRHGAVPALNNEYCGEASIETHTVIYNRGEPSHGIVIARTPKGARVLARVSGADKSGLAELTNSERSPIGSRGRTSRSEGELLYWS
jgi:acetyl-CoA C-acetyltransferase